MGGTLLKFEKIFGDVIFNSTLRCHNLHFDVSRQLEKRKVFIVSLFFYGLKIPAATVHAHGASPEQQEIKKSQRSWKHVTLKFDRKLSALI